MTTGGARQTCLLVDDDELVLRTLTRIASETFDVLVASSLEEALEHARRYGDRIDAVLCDLTLGQSYDGLAVLRAIDREVPGLWARSAVMTGAGPSDPARQRVEASGLRTIVKPVGPRELRAHLGALAAG